MQNDLELLIDEDCPMCNMYGKYLAKNNLVSLNSYQNSAKQKNEMVNYEKAKNQIALLDHNSNKTLYGLDALYMAFGAKFPRVIQFMKLSLPARLMPIVYAFISYNRKQIAPSNSKICNPNFVLKYRIAFLLFGLIFSAFIFKIFCQKIIFDFIHFFNFGNILFLIIMHFCFQFILLSTYKFEKRMDYLGNLCTVFIIGNLLLIPIVIFSIFLELSNLFLAIYILLLVFFLIKVHFKRCKIIGVGYLPSVSFMAFLFLIFFLKFFASFVL